MVVILQFTLLQKLTPVIKRIPEQKKNDSCPVVTLYDSGACPAFIQDGSSGYQMTDETVMNFTTRLPDCAGQATDAASA